MKKRIHFYYWMVLLLFPVMVRAQTAEEVIKQVKEKIDKVNDYVAQGKMKTNVVFLKVPIANVKIYFKKPNKLKIHNENGISFVPRGSANISLFSVFSNTNYDIIDAGKEKGTDGLRIIKLLPRDDSADVVLSTLYIDEKQMLITKARTTTKENGTYELEMTYGKYSDYGLADKVVFSFNVKEYKLPKGVTFDYEIDGKNKKTDTDKNKKGRVEITYSGYTINKGVPDSVFQ